MDKTVREIVRATEPQAHEAMRIGMCRSLFGTLMRLGETDPIVGCILKSHEQYGGTFADALASMVVEHAKHNRRLQEMLMGALEKKPAPFLVPAKCTRCGK